jgi:hypothetical protein
VCADKGKTGIPEIPAFCKGIALTQREKETVVSFALIGSTIEGLL